MSTMRKKKKCYNSCSANIGCNPKKEKESYCEPCKKPVYKKCEPVKKLEPTCCPPGPCDDCEIKFDDTCVKLAQEAERLFKKALDCECLAVESYEEAKEFDKKAKALEAKAKKLAKESMDNETEAEKLRKQANQLLCKSEDLCARAKCLYKEAEQAGDEAEQYCEKAKCLYEKSQNVNEQAKCLYSQAMKCDEKAMKCYKVAGEKIKEYEGKSKKCEDMMKKCQEKIAGCYEMEDCKPKKSCYVDLGIEEPCKEKKSCKPCKPIHTCKEEKSCKPINTCKEEKPSCTCEPKYVSPTYCKPKKEVKQPCGCEFNFCNGHNNNQNDDEYCNLDDIMLIKEEETGLYINPIYNMEPMQYMGEFANKYPSMDEPYMYMENMGMEEMQDMWMNYYMYMQNMMNNMMYNLED
ncbi:hypothetical protein [Paraclostridium bifermentans]|uniref:hypothetical protein n=1 Tax=Paraclostridium bifermentans TaxID=1490 RepID=UPI0006B39329|nr:hypothetical protein [Paraclostridium bifermentans]OSB10586.1 hypothetical protein B2H97_06385 [Paraclostridium bifermentans]